MFLLWKSLAKNEKNIQMKLQIWEFFFANWTCQKMVWEKTFWCRYRPKTDLTNASHEGRTAALSFAVAQVSRSKESSSFESFSPIRTKLWMQTHDVTLGEAKFPFKHVAKKVCPLLQGRGQIYLPRTQNEINSFGRFSCAPELLSSNWSWPRIYISALRQNASEWKTGNEHWFPL